MKFYICPGEIKFDEVEEKMGYKLTEEDKEIWNKFYCRDANISKSEMKNCFHIFENPLCVNIKGEEAMEAIEKMFTKDKQIKDIEFLIFKVDDKKIDKLSKQEKNFQQIMSKCIIIRTKE